MMHARTILLMLALVTLGAGCDSKKVGILGPPDGSSGGGPSGAPGADSGTAGGAGLCPGGTCPSGCLPGLDACAGSCVDRASDNRNCGSCGNVCPTGKGCVKGRCEDAVPVGPGPAGCAGGGPPIKIAANQGGCLGALAQTTFRWGLCSCKDVRVSDKLLVDAYDSGVGLYHPGGLGGGVAANGAFETSASAEIWGTLWCASDTGVDAHASSVVKQELRVGGPFHTSDHFTVGNDAYVEGNVATSSSIAIGKALHVPSTSTVSDDVTYATLVREPVTVPPPCDCQPQQLIPIGDIVAAHRPPNNDNALLNLDPAVFTAHGGPRRLDLPCGSYYLTKIDQSMAVTIAAHGRTALFIDGDVHNSDALTFALDPGAELDIFIAGTIDSSDKLTIGSPNYPARSRTYVGSPNGLSLSAGSRIGGNLYAAYGLVKWSAGSDLYGSIFAGDFTASASTVIHYDRATLGAGDACTPPPATPPPDAGAPPGCGTCKDCGNQACINGTCGACRTSADCCAPLVCGADGMCIANVVP